MRRNARCTNCATPADRPVSGTIATMSTERLCTLSGPSGDVRIGTSTPDGLVVIAGPCSLESEALSMEVAEHVSAACARLGLGYVFKGSFDKANRTSAGADRGPGMDDGLGILERVRREFGVPVTTDVHHPEQATPVAQVVDLLQVPAFLCRQTDLLVAVSQAAAASGGGVNIKKGQFLSPAEMLGPVRKCEAAGCENLLITERGTFFGYHRLVTDLIGVGDMIQLDVSGGGDGFDAELTRRGGPPVCFDATHSAQLPGASAQSGGRGERVPLLARAAVAAGVHAVFIETHPEPAKAVSDGATMVPLDRIVSLLERLCRIREALFAG